MMKNLSVKTFYKACGGLCALLFVLFFALILYSKTSLFVKLSLHVIVLFLGLLCFLMVWFASRKIAYFSENINGVLDEMLGGKDDIVFELYEETLTSKVQSKLRQLYEMMLEHARRSEHEKVAIQSLVSDISHQVKTPIANIKMYHYNGNIMASEWAGLAVCLGVVAALSVVIYGGYRLALGTVCRVLKI